MIRIDLPIPPSVNGIFRNVPGVGRAQTRTYKRWQEAAGWELKAQRFEKLAGPVSVSIECGRPSATSDIDNRIKGCLDFLVQHALIDDDRNVRRVSAEWSDQVAKGRCRVTVTPA